MSGKMEEESWLITLPREWEIQGLGELEEAIRWADLDDDTTISMDPNRARPANWQIVHEILNDEETDPPIPIEDPLGSDQSEDEDGSEVVDFEQRELEAALRWADQGDDIHIGMGIIPTNPSTAGSIDWEIVHKILNEEETVEPINIENPVGPSQSEEEGRSGEEAEERTEVAGQLRTPTASDSEEESELEFPSGPDLSVGSPQSVTFDPLGSKVKNQPTVEILLILLDEEEEAEVDAERNVNVRVESQVTSDPKGSKSAEKVPRPVQTELRAQIPLIILDDEDDDSGVDSEMSLAELDTEQNGKEDQSLAPVPGKIAQKRKLKPMGSKATKGSKKSKRVKQAQPKATATAKKAKIAPEEPIIDPVFETNVRVQTRKDAITVLKLSLKNLQALNSKKVVTFEESLCGERSPISVILSIQRHFGGLQKRLRSVSDLHEKQKKELLANLHRNPKKFVPVVLKMLQKSTSALNFEAEKRPGL